MLALLLPALVLLGAVYVYPLARLVVESVVEDGAFTLDKHAALFETSVFLEIVWRTFWMTSLVTLGCVVIGYPLAYSLNRLPLRLAVPLLLLVSASLFTSLLMRSYSWLAILSNNGLVNRALLKAGVVDHPVGLTHNELGVLIGLIQIQLPLLVLPTYAVMRRIDPSAMRAARILGAPPASAFWHVFRPLSMPGLSAGILLVFITTLGVFITPALLGGPGEYWIAQSIQIRVSRLADFDAATAQATVLLLAVIALLVVFRRPLGLSVQIPGTSTRGELGPPRSALLRGLARTRAQSLAARERGVRLIARPLAPVLSVVARPVLVVTSTLTLLLIALPLVVVVLLAFSDAPFLVFPPPAYSTRWFESYLNDPVWIDSTMFSLGVAFVSALLATLLGALAAVAFVRARAPGLGALQLLCISPIIVPQMVLGLALFFVLAPAGFVGHRLGFVAAYTALVMPFAILVMTAALRRFDTSLEQAAASLGAGPLRVARFVTVPLLLPAVATSLLFSFLIAFDELIIALFLAGPDAVPLPIRMWEDLRNEISPRIAAISVLLLATTVVVLIAVSAGRKAWMTRRRWG